MRLFAEIEADQALAAQIHRARDEVEKLDDALLSQVDDDSYALRILSEVRVDPLKFRFDEASISMREEMIPAEHHSEHQRLFLEEGESYLRQVVRYHLPFDGDPGLLRCIPNPRVAWTIEVDITGNEITFDIVNWSDDANTVKNEANQIFGDIRRQNEYLTKQVEQFNASAQTQIMQLLSNRRAKLKKNSEFVSALGLPVKESKPSRSEPSQSSHPASGVPPTAPKSVQSSAWDVFIAHASEDKEAFVRDLAVALAAKGLKVWYDEFTLTLGDSLRRSIDHGLTNSRFGIVVLSKNFFSKEWPQRELDGLVTKEVISGKLILPVWHNVSKEDVASFSPILADRLAVTSGKGIEHVVNEILIAIKKI